MTLCAATSVNLSATLSALNHSLDGAEFAECLLLTDAAITAPDRRIRIVPIERLSSGSAYSEFMLRRLPDFISTPHVLVIQWDGFVLDPRRWDSAFLDFDYVGAPWPQFGDRHDVGNGGFSLRSQRLLHACRAPAFQLAHPEDVAIGRLNRTYLEREHGIRFADRETAARFSFERELPSSPTFGFHGIFNMIPLLGADRFWELYLKLDDRGTAFLDYSLLMRQLGSGASSMRRRYQLTRDRIRGLFKRW